MPLTKISPTLTIRTPLKTKEAGSEVLAQQLWSKNVICGSVYDEKALKALFAEVVRASIQRLLKKPVGCLVKKRDVKTQIETVYTRAQDRRQKMWDNTDDV